MSEYEFWDAGPLWGRVGKSGAMEMVDARRVDDQVIEYLLWRAGFKPVND